MKKHELVEKAIEVIKEDEEIFVNCVQELDNWNGFADGFRCFAMDELDDLFSCCKPSDFLDKIDFSDFNPSDNYIVDTIYGLQSCNYPYDVYSTNTDEGEILDNLIDNYGNLDINYISEELDELVKKLAEGEFEE